MSKLKASTIKLVKEVEGNLIDRSKEYFIILKNSEVLKITFFNESKISGVLIGKNSVTIKEFYLKDYRDTKRELNFSCGFEYNFTMYSIEDVIIIGK